MRRRSLLWMTLAALTIASTRFGVVRCQQFAAFTDGIFSRASFAAVLSQLKLDK